MATQTHYDVLKIPTTATEKEVVQAYRVLIRQHHPDRVGPSGQAMTQLLNHAYDVLGDPARRRDYDRKIKPPEPAATPNGGGASQQPAQPGPHSFRTQTATPRVTPSNREWADAFPPGSRRRVITFAVAVLVTASGVGVAAATQATNFAVPYIIISMLGGLLLRRPRPRWGAYVVSLLAAGAGFAGAFLGFYVGVLPGWGLLLAAGGWVFLTISERAWLRLRRRYVEARQWDVMVEVAHATGLGPYWVRRVEGQMALVEDMVTSVQQTVHVWGDLAAGQWVALNSAGSVVGSAPELAFRSSQWVADDLERIRVRKLLRAARFEKRNEARVVRKATKR
jgi:hypothetical protein